MRTRGKSDTHIILLVTKSALDNVQHVKDCIKNTNFNRLLFVCECIDDAQRPKRTLHLEAHIPFPGISSCHFRLLVQVHPMGNTLIWGEFLLKDPERPIHSEWYGGSIMSLSLAATLGPP